MVRRTKKRTWASIISLNRSLKLGPTRNRRDSFRIGEDGTAGLRAIKAAGGLTFAQDPETANSTPCRGMRFNPALSMRSFRRRNRAGNKANRRSSLYSQRTDDTRRETSRGESELAQASNFSLVEKAHGRRFFLLQTNDFKSADPATDGVASDGTIGAIHSISARQQKEIQELFNDLLINVTQFFRDKGLFIALRKKILPRF